MHSRRVTAALWAAVFISTLASAGWQWEPLWNPHAEPSIATPDQDIVYTAAWDGCGVLEEPLIERNGRVIQVTQPIDVICGVPPGPLGVLYHLGQFVPGTYTVHVVPCFGYWVESCEPGTPPADVTFRVVGGDPPVAAPALDPLSAAALLVGVLIVGMWYGYRRRRRSD
jgi:hypothetical protein